MDFLFTSLLVFMLIGSIIAIEIRNLLASVIAVGVVGFAVSVLFLFLGAPDIAITQVIVEVLSLVILIRATVKADNVAIEKRIDNFANVIALVFVGFFLSFAWVALRDMPRFGQPLMRVSSDYVKYAISEVKAANVVAAIILDYRGYDTLGEAIVLFVSILGAFVILRQRGKKKTYEEDTEHVGIME